jgi:hypothetical protein
VTANMALLNVVEKWEALEASAGADPFTRAYLLISYATAANLACKYVPECQLKHGIICNGYCLSIDTETVGQPFKVERTQ